MTLLNFPEPLAFEQPRHRTQAPAIDVHDAAERSDALDINRSWIVEAPAGSGKTGLLVLRYLKLLGTVDRPEAVLAITFTRKATTEMRNRILDALHAATLPLTQDANPLQSLTHSIASALLAHDAARGWDLLHQPDRLNIQTIDGLCRQIARAKPLEAGGIGRAEPVEDAGDLYREAAHRVFRLLGVSDTRLSDALQTVLLHRNGDLVKSENLLADMLGKREQWGGLIPLNRSHLEDEFLETVTRPRLDEAVEKVICGELARLEKAFPPDTLCELVAIAQGLATEEDYKSNSNPFRACAALSKPPCSALVDLVHWQALINLLLTKAKKGEWRASFKPHHSGFYSGTHEATLTRVVTLLKQNDDLLNILMAVRKLPAHPYPENQWLVLKALFRVLQHALLELKVLFAEREQCDFAELSLTARAIFRDHGSLESALTGNLQHLLVDEVQDTSTGQYELLEDLTRGWDGITQTVFLVGDPKQSIYLFRQAQVERFAEGFRTKRLGDVPLGTIRLSSNFRTGIQLLSDCNTLLEAAFKKSGGDRVTFTASQAGRNEIADGESLEWHAEVVPYIGDSLAMASHRKKTTLKQAARLAETAARWHRRLTRSGKQPSIAVLVRSRSHAPEIIAALKAAGLPVAAMDIDRLDETPEVLDALALTRAILHPSDRVAWLALLRAPWCGLSLPDIHLAVGGDDPTHRDRPLRLVLQERAHLLSQEAGTRLSSLMRVMNAAVEDRRHFSLAVEVEHAWASLGGDLCVTAAGKANLRRYLELLDKLAASGETVTLPRIRQAMERLYAESAAVQGAVEVLTMHTAKGLEWDVVFIPSLHRKTGFTEQNLLNWIELHERDADGNPLVLLSPIQKQSSKDEDPLRGYITRARTLAESEERTRLLYVAATRARTSLHLFAAPRSKEDGEAYILPSSLLQPISEIAQTKYRNEPTQTEIALTNEEVFDGLEQQGILPLAASAEPESAPPRHSAVSLTRLTIGTIDSLQLAADALNFGRGPQSIQQPNTFHRPEGSLAARAVGNAVHLFLEHLAGLQVSSPQGATERLHEIELWQPRIRNVLRGSGLAPREVDRFALLVLDALRNTIRDPLGWWLLQPHPESRSEGEYLTKTPTDGAPLRYRLDRSFFAGIAPGEPGDALWIVDFKTGTHSAGSLARFLEEQRERYAPQLETYARARQPDLPSGTPIVLGLYHPMIPRLQWWTYNG